MKMKAKMLEVRDKGTFIPVMCVETKSENQDNRYLLGRAGFGENSHLIQLVWISREQTHYYPIEWDDRTMYRAHTYITENWDKISCGDVIDVEYILGETDTPKISERFVY
jgi:hypothetical protein